MKSVAFRRAVALIRTHFNEKTWLAFWMSAVEERTIAEIADVLGMTPASVRQTRSRVRRYLVGELRDILDLDDSSVDREIASTRDKSTSDQDAPTLRTVQVSVYLSAPSDDEVVATEQALSAFCNSLSFDLISAHEPEIGSWFRRLLWRTRDAASSDQVVARLRRAERALELLTLEKPQADADNPRLTGAAELLTAIGDNDAVVQIGSVLLVMANNASGRSTVVVRTLTQSELHFLDHNQSLLKNPGDILEALAQNALVGNNSPPAIEHPEPNARKGLTKRDRGRL